MIEERKVIGVSEVNAYIAQLMSADSVLSDITVKGEISNFKRHSTGHLYFSLKDDESKISCVMFRGNSAYLKFEPEDGMEVEVSGRVGVYEKSGAYQIYVNSMKKAGLGNLYEKYQKLMEELRKRGYFDGERKKPIPFMPQRIALVTSPTGAAVRDMISVIKRRFPIADVLVCPVLVQGEGAAWDIAQMMEYINENDLADVILLARGGGSIEELWAFNEIPVANAIYNSHIPVISGVGHETDFTIADFVADMRAPTPSVAAEIAVPDLAELKNKLKKYDSTLYEGVLNKIKRYRDRLDVLAKTPALTNPNLVLEQKYLRLDALQEAMIRGMNHKLSLIHTKLDSMGNLLKSLSHENVLNRGYFMVRREGVAVNIEELRKDDDITIFSSGMSAECIVKNVKEM